MFLLAFTFSSSENVAVNMSCSLFTLMYIVYVLYIE